MELFKYIVKFIYRIRWWATNLLNTLSHYK